MAAGGLQNDETHWLTANLWRGSLLPLGRKAALRFCDCCAAEREQAPSPQLQPESIVQRFY
ncbi:hypothetical protein EMIT0194MI4_120046 [Pseudomonas sp. IT-194MI4]